ncbi:cobalamin-independent methionine synthase II family protein [Candidatus Entotheonella palauensis]|uniref:cobalamin-independent methionine synthase II family protein n=1 Tax=Candidatus Entotheonella palauensis TaxID=93172 RepID=UPI000B7FADC6|nr:cobalamin-independent methionine synthase II family protein [Candidatus Entotheonella palauensis]
MKRSTMRILTTHTGSLPRPEDVVIMLNTREAGELANRSTLEARVREAVADCMSQQQQVGIDVMSDGEMGKIAFWTYVKDRLTGFEGDESPPFEWADLRDYPATSEPLVPISPPPIRRRPSCNGPITYQGQRAVEHDIANLREALRSVNPEDVFLPAASPGVIAMFMQNRYYPNETAYLYALADAMKQELNAIHQAGFLLQLDCPDLAAARHLYFADAPLETFRAHVSRRIEVLNHAVADIPPDRMRLHLCWGNYEGPHHRDVPFRDIIDLVLQARVGALSFEAANPRHAHEWQVFEDVSVPEDMILIPGVVDSTTNFIEHPELIAQRIVQYAKLVGRERVIAGTDCGFATNVNIRQVNPAIAWAKLQAMAEGAQLASQQLW